MDSSKSLGMHDLLVFVPGRSRVTAHTVSRLPSGTGPRDRIPREKPAGVRVLCVEVRKNRQLMLGGG